MEELPGRQDRMAEIRMMRWKFPRSLPREVVVVVAVAQEREGEADVVDEVEQTMVAALVVMEEFKNSSPPRWDVLSSKGMIVWGSKSVFRSLFCAKRYV